MKSFFFQRNEKATLRARFIFFSVEALTKILTKLLKNLHLIPNKVKLISFFFKLTLKS